MALRIQPNAPIHAPIPLPLRGTRLRVGPLCRCATSPHTVGSHPLHKGGFTLGCRGEHCSPVGSCIAAELHGRTLFAPTPPCPLVLQGGVLTLQSAFLLLQSYDGSAIPKTNLHNFSNPYRTIFTNGGYNAIRYNLCTQKERYNLDPSRTSDKALRQPYGGG